MERTMNFDFFPDKTKKEIRKSTMMLAINEKATPLLPVNRTMDKENNIKRVRKSDWNIFLFLNIKNIDKKTLSAE